MSVSANKNKTAKPNHQYHTLSEGLKLGGTVCILTAAAEQLNKQVNNKAINATPKDYLYAGIMAGIVASSAYGIASIIAPMWREITEYRPNEIPFLTASRYLNTHNDTLHDIYS